MQLSSLLLPVVALAAGANASSVRACTGTSLSGTCSVRSNSVGFVSGNFKSYSFTKTSDDLCVKICVNCAAHSYRCTTGTVSNISSGFTKAILFNYALGSGYQNTNCC